ncbi:DUF228 domain-containing protein [Borrelia hispanica]|uniref:DUF228 domain-containing protein n=1 Tax=Borrelia hispanica TaxID=40835 RepID=UPI0004653FF8|nr:DUF228 domain-containing protein [Borrelia hispanica]
MADIAKLKKEYEDKLKEIKSYMKNPSVDPGLFSNNTEFRDKNLHFAASGGTTTSSVDIIENMPSKGYPYKRGVKLDFSDVKYEPVVVPGGGSDLYGICIDIDDYTETAQVVPINNNFQGWLIAKKDNATSIAIGDKLKFNNFGELEKDTSSSRLINAVALSKAFKLNENLYIIHVSIFGNRAKS